MLPRYAQLFGLEPPSLSKYPSPMWVPPLGPALVSVGAALAVPAVRKSFEDPREYPHSVTCHHRRNLLHHSQVHGSSDSPIPRRYSGRSEGFARWRPGDHEVDWVWEAGRPTRRQTHWSSSWVCSLHCDLTSARHYRSRHCDSRYFASGWGERAEYHLRSRYPRMRRPVPSDSRACCRKPLFTGMNEGLSL